MPRKIGVVDDSVTIRAAFELTFGGDNVGVDVSTFGSLEEIARAGEKFDLVIIDSRFEGADGYEACAKLRSLGQFASTPIALLLGPWDTWDEAKGKAAGAVGSLPKPWETENGCSCAASPLVLTTAATVLLSRRPPPPAR